MASKAAHPLPPAPSWTACAVDLPHHLPSRGGWVWVFCVGLFMTGFSLMELTGRMGPTSRYPRGVPDWMSVVCLLGGLMIMFSPVIARVQAWRVGRHRLGVLRGDDRCTSQGAFVEALASAFAWNAAHHRRLRYAELKALEAAHDKELPSIWIDRQASQTPRTEEGIDRFSWPVLPAWAWWLRPEAAFFPLIFLPIFGSLIGNAMVYPQSRASQYLIIVVVCLVLAAITFGLLYWRSRGYQIATIGSRTILCRGHHELAEITPSNTFIGIVEHRESGRGPVPTTTTLQWWFYPSRGGAFVAKNLPYVNADWQKIALEALTRTPSRIFCDSCGYSLAGLPRNATCPECGERSPYAMPRGETVARHFRNA